VSALRFVGQDDFAAGILRGPAPDVQPGIGVSNALNGLYNDDGDVYRRGGTIDSGMPAVPGPYPVQFVWSGYLSGIKRMLIGIWNTTYAVDPVTKARTQVWAGDFSYAMQGAVTNEVLYLPNGLAWGGASKAGFGGKQVTITPGSSDIVGISTAFTTSVEIGTLLHIDSASGFYRVVKIIDNTHLTVDRPPDAVAGGTVNFTAGPLAQWDLPPSLDSAGRAHVAAIAGRLVVAANNRIAFSEGDMPWSFLPDDYHDLPGGVIVMGLAPLRDTLLSFTNFGLWSISNMAYDLTDALGNIQQNLALISPAVSLWGEGGLAEWAGRIVAPCLDRVYLVDAVNPPQPISDSISRLYLSTIQTPGVEPGGAKVWRNHYFLPLVQGVASNRQSVGVQVCRLDRPVQGRLLYFPWSTFGGHGARMMAADVNLLGTTPTMLVGHQDGTLIDYGKIFDPDASVSKDADGTTHVFDVESRDFPTGNGQPNHVRKLRLRYSLDDVAKIQAGISFGTTGTDDSGFPPSPDNPARVWHKLDDTTPASSGTEPVAWPLPQAERVRYIRARFRCTDAVSRLVFHHLDFAIRAASHDR
jgi:hypothetical protein